ncbi:anti-repressor SinI family protein [Paenibacillus doosanensis]|uniref:Anti-repressor SinI n=1 Tax=Paenibacillus konkukensis TaxID=2020716 RepID=A0ABY4RTZ1_9BACL|nr:MULTISPECIES: anti-repressor SinI family protein [Paenibacillus]MCS7463275.1 anti-repressor SinI family protein [Paenibacillus doosanensis]UQZ85189.1 Anti-repressor SinI [Paenibacillus konkukensis]
MSVYRTLVPNKNLDENWLNLIIAAREMGISKKEVLQFIRHTQKEERRNTFEEAYRNRA